MESINQTIQNLLKTINKIMDAKEREEAQVDCIFEGKAKAWGNSAGVVIPKKYATRNVKIIVLKEGVKTDEQTELKKPTETQEGGNAK